MPTRFVNVEVPTGTKCVDVVAGDSKDHAQEVLLEGVIVEVALAASLSETEKAIAAARKAPAWRSATMTEMLAEAGAGAFDLLRAGYSDRWQRNLRRTLELLEDGLHPAGVALVMCDRRILSSDPQDWDELISEAAGAEKYSRRLSERITDGYAAKFDHRDDPGGHAGLGFRRLPEPPHTLQIDPDRMPIAVGLFERYALGNVSAK